VILYTDRVISSLSHLVSLASYSISFTFFFALPIVVLVAKSIGNVFSSVVFEIEIIAKTKLQHKCGYLLETIKRIYSEFFFFKKIPYNSIKLFRNNYIIIIREALSVSWPGISFIKKYNHSFVSLASDASSCVL